MLYLLLSSSFFFHYSVCVWMSQGSRDGGWRYESHLHGQSLERGQGCWASSPRSRHGGRLLILTHRACLSETKTGTDNRTWLLMLLEPRWGKIVEHLELVHQLSHKISPNWSPPSYWWFISISEQRGLKLTHIYFQ